MDATDTRIAEWIRDQVGGDGRRHRAQQARWRPVWFARRRPRRRAPRHHGARRPHRRRAAVPARARDEASRSCSRRTASRYRTSTAGVDEPRAFVIDAVAGANNFERATDAERAAVMDEYMGILARIHALDPEPLRAGGRSSGPPPPRRPVSSACDVYEDGYRRTKARPDPFLEFCLGWLARNPVDTQGREAPVVWDSGQFHQEDGSSDRRSSTSSSATSATR